ncbi:hypothetical protein [Ramlibacter sp.]|uniref:hypothetical protein n=1 Tax=Ramlibacter sp. TaxID=1917967 RepID=UPI00257EA9E2|nr:hypothetical protein [Ramlibacter sp.]
MTRKPAIPAPAGDAPMASPPARSDIGENTASELVEAPQSRARAARDPLGAHDFADGGGSGGAERFSRVRTKARRRGEGPGPGGRP